MNLMLSLSCYKIAYHLIFPHLLSTNHKCTQLVSTIAAQLKVKFGVED
jgi:hypothetical protein